MNQTHKVHDNSGHTYLAYSRAEAIYIRDTVGGSIVEIEQQGETYEKARQGSRQQPALTSDHDKVWTE